MRNDYSSIDSQNWNSTRKSVSTQTSEYGAWLVSHTLCVRFLFLLVNQMTEGSIEKLSADRVLVLDWTRALQKYLLGMEVRHTRMHSIVHRLSIFTERLLIMCAALLACVGGQTCISQTLDGETKGTNDRRCNKLIVARGCGRDHADSRCCCRCRRRRTSEVIARLKSMHALVNFRINSIHCILSIIQQMSMHNRMAALARVRVLE